MNAITFAITMLNSLPPLIAAGVDVVNLIKSTNASLKTMQLEDRDPTDTEWEALDKMIKDLRAKRLVV